MRADSTAQTIPFWLPLAETAGVEPGWAKVAAETLVGAVASFALVKGKALRLSPSEAMKRVLLKTAGWCS